MTQSVIRNDRIICRAIVRAPIEHVWAALTDLAAYPLWHPSTELAAASPAPLREGSVLVLRTNAGTPLELTFSVTVTKVDAPSELVWEGGDPATFYGRHSWTLTPVGDGTQITETEIFSGALVATVLAAQATTIENQYATSLTALVARSEKHR